MDQIVAIALIATLVAAVTIGTVDLVKSRELFSAIMVTFLSFCFLLAIEALGGLFVWAIFVLAIS